MPLDFARLRAGLAEQERAAELRIQAQQEALLVERARRIAARMANEQQVEAHGDFVVVRRAEARFGLPAGRVIEVRPVVAVRIPGATAVIQGVFQVRGRVHALADLLPLFGTHASVEHGETVTAALIDGQQGRIIGVRIDEAVELRTVAVRDLDTGRRDRGVAFVDHVTTDLVQLLDVDLLLTLPQLSITGDRAP